MNLHVNVLYTTHSHIHELIYLINIHCMDTCTCMYKHWFFFSIIVPTTAWKKFKFHVPVSHTLSTRGFRHPAVKVKERSPFPKAWITKTGQEVDISDVSCQLGIKQIALIWADFDISGFDISGNFFVTQRTFAGEKKIVLIYPDFDITDLDI